MQGRKILTYNFNELFSRINKPAIILFSFASIFFILPHFIFASVIGSPHDSSTKQCNICHVYTSEETQIPLWEINTGNISYNLYTSPTNDMKTFPQEQSTSFLCMGCHNGVFSVLMINTIPFIDEENYSDPVTDLIDFNKNHPVCFQYEPMKDFDDNKFPPITIIPGNILRKGIFGSKTGTYYPLYGSDFTRFECTTCHNPHYPSSDLVPSKYQELLLRADNSSSNMCKDCHQNK
jgi:hypothetical protein